MPKRRTFLHPAVLLALTLAATAWTASGQQVNRSTGSDTPRLLRRTPADAAGLAARQRFLEMFARAYVPGRTGQLLLVPQKGDFITRPDPFYTQMHGSPWPYDVEIPLMFIGPAVKPGRYSMPAVQQDIAPTLAAALGAAMPPIATGADPGVHGITGVSMYDFEARRRHDVYAGCVPKDLLALTLADVWQRRTAGRAVIVAQGSIDRATTPLAGHGACLPNGSPVVCASYDQPSGAWHTNPNCYRLPDYLKDVNASELWRTRNEWMGHPIDTTTAVRYSALFPAFESNATIAMIEHEPVGEDSVADLILLNYKCADFVGHKYGGGRVDPVSHPFGAGLP